MVKYHCNPRSAMIALTTTSFTDILPLGSVHFELLYKKSHDFYHGIFCFTTGIMMGRGADGIAVNVSGFL